MSGRPKTPAQKVGEWQQVYQAVLDEISPRDGWDETPHEEGQMFVQGRNSHHADAARRTAAIVAAMLVGQNVRMPVETLAEDDPVRDPVIGPGPGWEADPGWPPQDS